jgi:hypothetical protein
MEPGPSTGTPISSKSLSIPAGVKKKRTPDYAGWGDISLRAAGFRPGIVLWSDKFGETTRSLADLPAGRLGEIRDRSYENQRHRSSGLNLLVAAIILWNTVYL